MNAVALPVSTVFDVDVRQGQSARALLHDREFQQAWSALHATCAWATICQSHAFADAWFRVYSDQYDALIVHARDASGALCGLLTLAIDNASDTIVHVGAQQAEYQVWIATEHVADAFAAAALDALAQRFPRHKLVLQFLPPRVPLGWRAAGTPWAKKTLLLDSALPMLTLGADGHVEASLKKKKNKSRMSALHRSGPVRLVQLRTRAELEAMIDRIAEQYDFRQRALADAMPFRDDPRKRRFLLALVDKPGLLSAAVLMVGDDIAATNIGLVDRDSVAIGVLAHSPFFAEHSPGKLLVLLLARELAKEGYSRIDLTPGGTYKFRFADYRDTAHILEIYFDRAQCTARNARKRVTDAGKTALRALRLDPDDVKAHALALRQRLFAGGVRNVPRNLARMVGRYLSPRQDVVLYVKERGRFGPSAHLNAMKRDCLADLLDYEQRAPGDPPAMSFLLEAQTRLVAGAHVYTMSGRGGLVHRAWLAKRHGTAPHLSPSRVSYPPRSCVMWDDYTYGPAAHAVTFELSMLQRMHDAARMPDVERIFLEVPAGNAVARACAEKLGFDPFCVVAGGLRERRQAIEVPQPASLAGGARELGRLSSLFIALFAFGLAASND